MKRNSEENVTQWQQLESFPSQPADTQKLDMNFDHSVFKATHDANAAKTMMGSSRTSTSRPPPEGHTSLLDLSFDDRNAIIEEIHGVSCMAPDESPELLDAGLYSLSLELEEIEDKEAYNLAQEMHLIAESTNPEYGHQPYVNTDEFRLRFLRCELFNPKKAAERMVKYLNLIHQTFGREALTRPLRLSDFSREEMSFLRGGDYQLLPYRDRSGRRLLCIVTNNRDDVTAKTRLKVLIYLWVVAAEDVESQRKGMVAISYSGPKITVTEKVNNANSKQQKFHQSRVMTHAVVGAAVPMRCVAIHFCLPDTPLFHVLTKIYSMALGQWSARVKCHLGKNMELRYQLQGFGIPIELIPSTDTGNVKQVNLKNWIKLREYLEKQPQRATGGSPYSYNQNAILQGYQLPPTQPHQQFYNWQQNQQIQLAQVQQQTRTVVIVECPGSNDVIFRRGKSMTYHPGNAMFQSLIESKLEEHTNATQAGKLLIVSTLIQYVQKVKGGRFLTWDSKNNWWADIMTIPISGNGISENGLIQGQELEIQSKVSYAFRDFKKKLKTRQELQVSKSSTYAFERQDGSKRKRVKGNREGGSCGGCICSGSDNDNGMSDGD